MTNELTQAADSLQAAARIIGLSDEAVNAQFEAEATVINDQNIDV